MNNPFQTTTVKEKALKAAPTAQATVQKAKHRVDVSKRQISLLIWK